MATRKPPDEPMVYDPWPIRIAIGGLVLIAVVVAVLVPWIAPRVPSGYIALGTGAIQGAAMLAGQTRRPLWTYRERRPSGDD